MSSNDTERFALHQAALLLEAGRHDAAIAIIAPHLARHPDDAIALNLAAEARYGAGDLVGTAELAGRSVALNPTAWPLRLSALAFSGLNRSDDAVAAARAAVHLEPESWLSHHVLACALQTDEGQLPAALVSAQEARRLAPDEPAVHRLFGAILHRLGHRRQARESYRRALHLDPSDAVARHELARADYQRGALAKAVQGFSGAVATDPRLDVGARNLGRVAHLLLMIVALVVGSALVFTDQAHPSSVLPALATGVVVVAAAVFVQRSGPALIPFLRYVRRAERGLVVGFALCALAMVLIWVRILWPGSISPAMNLAIPVLLLAARWGFRPHRRSGRPPAR